MARELRHLDDWPSAVEGCRQRGLRALFLTWDGPQQTYLESLFFPIFSGLRGRGIDVHTLQLTWARAEQIEPVRQAAARLGLTYTSRRVPARLRKLGLPAAIALGAAAALLYTREQGIETLLPRSLLPMAMALMATRTHRRLDLAFEADGLMADERLDFGGWSERGLSYRVLRGVEASGVRSSRSVICRTQAAREILISRAGNDAQLGAKIFVAPNAKDSTEFSPGTPAARLATRARHRIEPAAPWIVYLGSLGPQYLPELMLASMARLRRRLPAARFSLFTLHADVVKPLLARHGLTECLDLRAATPREIPSILAAADLGFALRLETFSQRAICPIKVAEYLLCGVPVVTSPVGDLATQLRDEPAALVMSGAAPDGPERIADWFERSVLPEREGLRESARELGLRWFDLAGAVATYEAMLRYGSPGGRC